MAGGVGITDLDGARERRDYTLGDALLGGQTLEQSLFGVLEFGDVREHVHAAADATVLVSQRLERDPHPAAVLLQSAHLGLPGIERTQLRAVCTKPGSVVEDLEAVPADDVVETGSVRTVVATLQRSTCLPGREGRRSRSSRRRSGATASQLGKLFLRVLSLRLVDHDGERGFLPLVLDELP